MFTRARALNLTYHSPITSGVRNSILGIAICLPRQLTESARVVTQPLQPVATKFAAFTKREEIFPIMGNCVLLWL